MVYEIDQPEVIEFKTSTLAQLGAVPTAWHRTVGIDLREDWPAALQEAGFDPTRPTAWLAEGMLMGFLPPEAEVRLLDNVIALSAPGSRFSADFGTTTGTTAESQEQARQMSEALATAGTRPGRRRVDLPGRAHRRRRASRGEQLDSETVPAQRPVRRRGATALGASDRLRPGRHDQLRAGDPYRPLTTCARQKKLPTETRDVWCGSVVYSY